MRINYHIHTPLCNHATGTMPEYIRQAIALGFTEICFLDHLTLNAADRGLTMSIEEVPLYYHSARRLANQFRDDILVKVGLEIDYHPDVVGSIDDIVNTFDFDAIGSSIHYVGDFDIVTRRSGWRNGEGNTDTIYAQYLALMDRMLNEDYFDLICHFDLPKKYGRLPSRSFKGEIDALLAKIKTKGIAIEINTSGFDSPIREMYPSLEILRSCQALGIPVTLGSDAHRPDQLDRCYGRAYEALNRIGLTQLTTFTKRRPGRIAINDTVQPEIGAYDPEKSAPQFPIVPVSGDR
ncbi:MAG: histidinol-phosphatase [Desulfobacterales bacterium]|nr:histidinol-phosphatase [Desulfobacterales bacterium]